MGLHNIRNATAASAVAYVIGISKVNIKKGLKGFKEFKEDLIIYLIIEIQYSLMTTRTIQLKSLKY